MGVYTGIAQESNAAVQVLQERYSVRKYKKDHVISDEELNRLLDLANQAPSAWNLQHWKVIAVRSAADKERLFPIAYSQKQVLDSSVTLAILGDTQANHNAEILYGQAAKNGALPQEVADRLIQDINRTYEHGGAEYGTNQAFLNASLFAMQLMIAAKALGYDTVPMTGFDSAALVKEFHVDSRYVPVMLISVGISDEHPHQTPRFPVSSILYKAE